MTLPQWIRPMMASLRHGLPEDQDRYGWEFKWDGVRAIAYVDGHDLRLVSRNDKDMASSYPELGVLADRVGTPVVLDGEIVALRDGRPDFGLLQSRMHVQRPTDRLVRSAPVKLYVFDLLHNGTESLLRLPYPDRRERVEGEHGRGGGGVHARCVGEVAFTRWPHQRMMRHRSWRRLRRDKNPEDSHRDHLCAGVGALIRRCAGRRWAAAGPLVAPDSSPP